MGFVNEELTQEERELFAQRNIVNPVYGNKEALRPKRWTINREKDAILVQLGVHREWPDETVFFYQLRDSSFVISLKRRYMRPNTIVWSFENVRYNPFEEIRDSQINKEIKDVLKQALEVHKAHGASDTRSEQLKVVCEF